MKSRRGKPGGSRHEQPVLPRSAIWEVNMNRRIFSMAVLGSSAMMQSGHGQAPGFAQFKPQPGSLKEKMHKREAIRSVTAPADSTRGQLEEIIKKEGKVDLFYLDGQHRPLPREAELVKFCKLAEELGAGVQVRLPHPRLAYLSGRFADLGVLSIMVPLVEDVATADDAIQNFYYPPLGNRSWGGEFRFGEKPPTDRLKYSAWWNGTGLLGFQVETLRAAINIRNLVKPGIDFIAWGPGDMSFDLERHSNTPFKTLEEVHSFVIEQLKGFDVRVPQP
jgi:2-keto-3-deoxy-L-rhamnonate aldolase RhmA